jgi:pectinesterase
MIAGATDFIFGQRASVWFEKNDLRVVSASVGYITGKSGQGNAKLLKLSLTNTANGRDSESNMSNYVFNNCNIAAAAGNNVANGAYYLGRPWRQYARVTFQKTSMSAVIHPAGWSIWNKGEENTAHVQFNEFGNTGAGASGNRASFSKKLGAAVPISSVLTSSYASKGFYDASYM